MRDRPSVSVAHVDNEELAVFSHGGSRSSREGTPTTTETLEHWTRHYGISPAAVGRRDPALPLPAGVDGRLRLEA